MPGLRGQGEHVQEDRVGYSLNFFPDFRGDDSAAPGRDILRPVAQHPDQDSLNKSIVFPPSSYH